MTDQLSDDNLQSVAIIGMAGKFPKAQDIEKYWQNLQEGLEAVEQFTEQQLLTLGVDAKTLADLYYVRSGVILEDIDQFDADFFGLTRREAELMDPQQRFLLENSYHALENAGYVPDHFPGLIGVYVGADISTYFLYNLLARHDIIHHQNEMQLTYANSGIATQLAYRLNLRGPCIDINTACSTSLVAIHLACKSLLYYECDLALAGGASIDTRIKKGYWHREGDILSPDGHCRPFDEKAQGTIAGSGSGIIVLKRLVDAIADHDHIYAVIRGSAVNNDGSVKVGFTAPSVEGQVQVIRHALASANVEPYTIDYIECHGTATPLGDPIELAALSSLFPSSLKQSLTMIGSVKANIGHLNSAAGVAGLIKVVQALRYKILPPSINFTRPNPKIDFDSTCLKVNDRLSPWIESSHPRRAGVSSFGIGGTNAHVVVEEASARLNSSAKRIPYIFTFSAKESEVLTQLKNQFADFVQRNPVNLLDTAYTLNVGRVHHNYRQAIVCTSEHDLVSQLKRPDASVQTADDLRSEPIAMLFPGQGAQHINMGKELLKEPVFSQALSACFEILAEFFKEDLMDVIFPREDNEIAAVKLQDTRYAQPILFAFEYALSCLWTDWGIKARYFFGHSLGEYMAAFHAGVFSLKEALWLITQRARLMYNTPPGAMLSVALSPQQLQPFLNEHCQLAAWNAPNSSVLSGPVEIIDQIERELTGKAAVSRLRVSHSFHSQSMQPMMDEYCHLLKQVKLNSPKAPFISCLTGDWIRPDQAQDPVYWAVQLRQPVLFADGLKKLADIPGIILLEVGPSTTLKTLVNLNKWLDRPVLTSCRNPKHPENDQTIILQALARLWEKGVMVHWRNFYRQETCGRISLPGYPFNRQSYWVGPLMNVDKKSKQIDKTIPISSVVESPIDNSLEVQLIFLWRELLGVEKLSVHDNFFDLGGHSLLATQLISRIYEIFQIRISLTDFFRKPTIAGITDTLLQSQLEGLTEEQLTQLLLDEAHENS